MTTSIPSRVLVTGALGQLGSGIVQRLRARCGIGNVLASDIRKGKIPFLGSVPEIASVSPNTIYLDVTNKHALEKAVVDHDIDCIIHFSALLSYTSEQHPSKAFDVNQTSVANLLDIGARHGTRIFVPSTIGVFGPSTIRDNVPDIVITRPQTIYGITKLHNELLGEWYARARGVDFRCIRYPGVLSAENGCGGGTTDYAMDVLKTVYATVQKAYLNGQRDGPVHVHYSCPLGPHRGLPMMHIDDCLDATLQMMMLPKSVLDAHVQDTHVFNVTGPSFTPREWIAALNQYLDAHLMMGMRVSVSVDYASDPTRDAIAATWPTRLNDDRLRNLLKWTPKCDSTEGLLNALMLDISKQNAIKH